MKQKVKFSFVSNTVFFFVVVVCLLCDSPSSAVYKVLSLRLFRGSNVYHPQILLYSGKQDSNSN